ncbi:MAG: Zn-ribbon domain-containing OB-fold protein [Acetobacteraceae bacterium]
MSEILKDTLDIERHPPTPSSFSAPYWEATRQKKLLVQRCIRTGKYQWFARPVSIFSGRRDLEWREVCGRGKVFTWTVTRRGPGAFRGHEPYMVATVTLDVGVNVIANLIHCPLDKCRVGLTVVPYWVPLPSGMHLLMFQPDEG